MVLSPDVEDSTTPPGVAVVRGCKDGESVEVVVGDSDSLGEEGDTVTFIASSGSAAPAVVAAAVDGRGGVEHEGMDAAAGVDGSAFRGFIMTK